MTQLRLARSPRRLPALLCAFAAGGLATLPGCGEDAAEDESPPAVAVEAPGPIDHAALVDRDDAALERLELRGGLLVETLRFGDGDPAPAGATITIRYAFAHRDPSAAGWTIYRSSAVERRPLVVPLDSADLAPGVAAGLAEMRLGEVRRVTIPAELGYGDRGRPPIPPGAMLRLIVERVPADR